MWLDQRLGPALSAAAPIGFTNKHLISLLSDGNARIDSKPDRVHARGALPESTRGFPHEPRMLHDAVFAFEKSERPQDPNRLEWKNSHGEGQNRPLAKI